MSSLDNQLINIISASPTAIAIVDLEMRYVAASRKWAEDYNVIFEKLIGKSHNELFPEIGLEWKAIHRECLQGKSRKNPQDKFIRMDGTVQWLSWDVRPWMDNNGMIGGMIMSSEDITDRMLMEIEIKKSNDLFNETSEAARIGSWEFDVLSGTIFWSQIVKKIYEVEEDFTPELSGIKQFYKEGTDPNLIENILFLAQSEGKSFDEDLEIITAKGKKQWIRLRGNPHFSDGQCTRISGTIQDIQELKMQSLLLRDSEEKYKSILENSLNPHFLIGTDGYILEANKAALDMFGYTIEEMRALKREEFIDISDPAFAAYLKERKETGSAKAELTGIRKNGERFLYEISSVFFTDYNGVQRTSVSMVDITDRKNAEENLRLSEAEFRAAFEYSALGMSLMDLDGNWIRINESFCKILGYTNRELMALNLSGLSHPEDLDKGKPPMEGVLRGVKKGYHLEIRYLHKNGAVVWVHQSGSIVLDINHNPSHWTVQIQDITEQKNTENILSEERELLRTLIDNIPTGIFMKDLQSRKLLVNKAECGFMGVTDASEILGKDNFELFPEEFAAVSTAEDQEVFTSGNSIIDSEKIAKWADGSQRHLLTSKIPLYDKGKIYGLLGITHDISKIKEAESALFESGQKFRKIFENIQDVFYQTDQAGLVTEAMLLS